MDARRLWARILIIVGGIAMLVGAIDPLEGSLLILPGSGLVALGTFLAHAERRRIAYRVWVFILIAIGVAALAGLSARGGFGGPSGLSNWWGLLILPYPIGWSLGVWGPDSPRWMLWLGIGVGLWYLTLFGMVMRHSGPQRWGESNLAVIVIAVLGLVTIGGCINRLRKPIPAQK